MKYILKVLSGSDDTRLTKILARRSLRCRSQFFKDWENTANKYNIRLNLTESNLPEWTPSIFRFLSDVEQGMKREYTTMATNSSSRLIYKSLTYEQNYIYSNLSVAQISIIFRTRGELLKLNYMPHRNDLPLRCGICNTGEKEDIAHFIGTCPILKETRRAHFRADLLTLDEIRSLLNGSDWIALAAYCHVALNYRTSIINENF